MEIIRLENVKKIYQTGVVITKAVDGIDFTVEKGEFTLIIGASGAGKTTVLNILGGMDSGNEGQVLIDGTDIAKYSPKELTTYRRNDVGFVFQFYNLVPNLTAKENVELAKKENPNFSDKVNPHKFRHSKATHLINKGVSVVEVKEFLGHVDLSSTQIYITTDLLKKREALKTIEQQLEINNNNSIVGTNEWLDNLIQDSIM